MKKRNKIKNFMIFNSSIYGIYFLFSFTTSLCNGEYIEREKLIVPLLLLVLIGVFVIVPLLYGAKVTGDVKSLDNFYNHDDLSKLLNDILIEAYMLLSTLIVVAVCALTYFKLLTMRDSLIFLFILFICSTYIETKITKAVDKITNKK